MTNKHWSIHDQIEANEAQQRLRGDLWLGGMLNPQQFPGFPNPDSNCFPQKGVDVIQERAKTHGDFSDTARIAGSIRKAFETSPNWSSLTPVAQESLTLMATKLARILSGDQFERDHWVDIGGYAALVVERLPK